MNVIRLLIDMDEVICDFLGELLGRYNELYQKAVTLEDVEHYDLTRSIGEEGRKIFLQAGFFDCLEPFPHALEVIRRLRDDGHDVVIVTNALGNPAVASDKCLWLQKHLPEMYPHDIFIASRKEIIKADLIFEDSPAVLNSYPGIRVVMDRPYNREVKGHRVCNNNWLDFYSLVSMLAKK